MSADSISAAVLAQVRRASGRRKKPTITREFSLGRSPVRADLAVLGDEFVGIEVKGPRDSLRRLPKQMRAYATYFDRVILVVDNRHLKNLDRGMLLGATLWSFDIEGHLSEVRAGGPSNCVDGESYLEMMTQEERRKLLLPLISEDNKAGIEREAARAAFFEAFRRRYSQTSTEFWAATSRRPVSADDLRLLSRFLEKKKEIKQIAEDRNDFWQRWATQNDANERRD